MINRFSQIVPNTGKMKHAFLKKAGPDGNECLTVRDRCLILIGGAFEAGLPHFLVYAAKLAASLRHAIFVDRVRLFIITSTIQCLTRFPLQVVHELHDKEEIVKLLREHIKANIVKACLFVAHSTVHLIWCCRSAQIIISKLSESLKVLCYQAYCVPSFMAIWRNITSNLMTISNV